MRASRWVRCGGSAVAAISMAFAATGCVAHRGAWQPASASAEPETIASPTADASPSDPAATTAATTAAAPSAVELVLLAGLAPEDRDAREVAARVEEILARAQGPRPIVLWLGNVASVPLHHATPRALRRGPRCRPLAPAWNGPAARVLVEAFRDPEVSVFAIPGVDDHRCGHAPSLQQEGDYGPHPWQMPGRHYVLRVYADGSTALRARCDDTTCQFASSTSPADPKTASVPAAEGSGASRDDAGASSTPQALVDLVAVDLAPWIYPAPTTDPSGRARDERLVQALEAMLIEVDRARDDTPVPRLLVSNVPVEAPGEHGMGALWPDATFHALPPALQTMLVQGAFAGVLTAHDRSLAMSRDLSDAIKRADRAWLSTPTFQVSAGAMAHTNDRAGMALRRRRVRESQAFRAETFSDHPGFAVVSLQRDRARVTLHAHRRRRWDTVSTTVPLHPDPHPPRTASPVMTPCRDCPPIPANER